MCSSLPDGTCNDSNNPFPTLFTGFLQIFTNKTYNTIKDTGLVSYLFHVLFFNISHSYLQCLIKNGLKQVRFLSVYFNILSTTCTWLKIF